VIGKGKKVVILPLCDGRGGEGILTDGAILKFSEDTSANVYVRGRGEVY